MKHIHFLLDMSGSMSVRIPETLDGYNTFISNISKEQETCVSLYTFNCECKPVYREIPLNDVPILTSENYEPYGNTALFDAMGSIISLNEPATLVVLTDGFENASFMYSKDSIKELIESSEWNIIYIGADLECANDIGVRKSMEYFGDDTAKAFEFASQSI